MNNNFSFAATVKNEICEFEGKGQCCALAELYGAFLFSTSFGYLEVKTTTKNRLFARRLSFLLKNCMGFDFDKKVQQSDQNKKIIYIISNPEKLSAIFSAFGYDFKKDVSFRLNGAMVENQCCQISFLRGAFLAAGTITDPDKRYHLEIETPHRHLANELASLLNEQSLASKTTARKSKYIIYFKESGAIEDFLTMVGAPSGSMQVMEAKLNKELRNEVNRKTNCDSANISKTVNAAQQQIEHIARIKAKSPELDVLPEQLKQVALLRLEYPELTLEELSRESGLGVTKSGMYHRFRRIAQIAEGIDN